MCPWAGCCGSTWARHGFHSCRWPSLIFQPWRNYSRVLQAVRLDGRSLQSLRPITCQTGPLPRVVHGSALFNRGETQAMAAATIGGDRDALEVTGLHGTVTKQLMLHYRQVMVAARL